MYHKAARKLDEKPGTPVNATGSVEEKMGTCNLGYVSGLVVGAFGEFLTQVRIHTSPSSTSPMRFEQWIHLSIGFAVHRGWA